MNIQKIVSAFQKSLSLVKSEYKTLKKKKEVQVIQSIKFEIPKKSN